MSECNRQPCIDPITLLLPRRMLDAAMSVVHGVTERLDVLKVEGAEGKTTYALCGLQAGAYRDARERTSKYGHAAGMCISVRVFVKIHKMMHNNYVFAIQNAGKWNAYFCFYYLNIKIK